MSAQSQIFNPTLKTSQASGEGFACPTMNTASRLAIVFGASDRGMMVYDTTLGNVMFWNGAIWVPLGGGGLVPVGASLNTQVIYNNAGVLEGDAGLTFNNVTDALTIVGPATVQGLTLGKGASAVASNVAFGTSALAAVTTASDCTALGHNALPVNISGVACTAVGRIALYSNVSGGCNTAIGSNALYQTVSAEYNTGVGYQALTGLTSGNYNTSIGSPSGATQTAGSNNGFFGSDSYADNTTGSNQYNYGNVNVTSHKFRAGDVVLGTGNVVVASAKGIDFSATAGAGTSELFDDYEEGTWTPTDASGAGLFIGSSGCIYTKIGRIVTIEGFIGPYPVNLSVLDAVITGLPFISVSRLGLNSQYGSETTLRYLYGGTSQNISLLNVSLTGITNTTMVGDSFFFPGTYTAAT